MKRKKKLSVRILSLVLIMMLLVQPQLIYGGGETEEAIEVIDTEENADSEEEISEASDIFVDGTETDPSITDTEPPTETPGAEEPQNPSGTPEEGQQEVSPTPGEEEMQKPSGTQDENEEALTPAPETEEFVDMIPAEKDLIQEPSDGSLAGNTVYFVDVNWESAPLAAVQAVFDGGTAEPVSVPMDTEGQGIYSAVIPQGDHSRITFQKPSEEAVPEDMPEEASETAAADFGDGTEAFDEAIEVNTYSSWTPVTGSWNYYGQESALENTMPVAYAAGTMDSFYFNTQSGEGYWGETPVKETGIRSDGSLAGQTMKFVNLYWGTDDLGEVEAVFDGGQDEALVQAMSRGDRGVYETTIPEGDYSRVSFRYAGSEESFAGSTYNFYGAVSDDGETKTVSFIPEKNNTLYYDIGEHPSYWGADPNYEVIDPETPVTVLKDQPQVMAMSADLANSTEEDTVVTAPAVGETAPEAGNPQPGQMVYAIDLDEREKYMAGQPANTYRVHIAFMMKGHTPVEDISQIPKGEGVIYTMYEKSTGVYSAPFPADVKKYSEIGFKLVTKEGQESPVNAGSRHYNFRGVEPTAEEQSKFGHFKYLSGITDTYYMNSQQDDSYWGAHPSNADQSLDTQVLYVDTNDKNENGIIIDINDIWISWHNMPLGTDGNFDSAKGWKVTDTLPHAGIRYFQFPKNSNATENTILTMRFKVVDKATGKPTPTYGDQEFSYKFTFVPRSQRNRLNLDYYWMFNGQMWDHFEAGEGLKEREVFFASIRNKYDNVWMRVAKEDGKYAGIEEIKAWGWTNEQIEEQVVEIKDKDEETTTWLKLNKVENPEEYRKEKEKLFRLKIPGEYQKVQFRTEEEGKFYYSNQTTISEEVAIPCYFAFQVGDPLENVPIEDVKEPGIVGQWASVYSVNNAGDQSVDIPQKEMEWEENVYYVDTTMYDYYSDWETTGKKVADWTTTDIQKYYRHQAKVFNAAADQYYRDKVNNANDSDLPALYEAQLEEDKTGDYFINEFTGEKYWNYDAKNQDGINQNRWTGSGGGPFFGIAAQELVNGNIVFNSEKDPNVIMPTFNEAFLRGDNIMDTAVGNVYKDVKFPIKMDEEEGSPTRGYWVYDSADDKDAFRLSYDVNEGYFMDRTGQGIKFRGRYAFYPFNDAADWSDMGPNYNIDGVRGNERNWDKTMSRANCLFGAKLEFQFSLTEDGMVADLNGNKVPITFQFQGDDDVWIYVDNKLVLDLGGNHDAVRGTINFAGNDTYKNGFYEIKKNLGTDYGGPGQDVTNGKGPLPEGILDPTKTHTLTMFYMERGLYESNMKLTFNFPRDNRFIVEKEVDVESTRTEGDDIFAGLLENMGSFNFNIKNLVTSGKDLPVEESAGYKEPGENTPLFSADPGSPVGAEFAFASEEAGTWTQEASGSVTVKQTAKISGAVPDESNLLKIKPTVPLDVADKDYLRLSMMNLGATDRNANHLYLSFVDTNGNRVGGYAGSLGYNGESNTFLANEDSILRIDFKEMTGDSDFSWNSVDYMLIGIRRVNPDDTAAYEISYASFYKQTEETPHIGFYVDDTQISDYGSYESGTLSPVDKAWYIKQNKGADGSYDTGASWNTEGGTFNLSDDQRAVFTDKFRTGSYIALNENREPKIFDTEWTLKEGGQEIPAKYLLSTRSDVTTVRNPLNTITNENPLSGVAGDQVADGREEIVDSQWAGGRFQSPDLTKTLVYRSYQDPDSSANIGTDLSVTVKNTLKRGKLTIKKKLTEGSKDKETGKYKPADFTFKIYYTDVAGRGLEKQLDPVDENNRYVLQTVKVHVDETGEGQITIPNIPCGTKYHIVEVPTNGTKLTGIDIDSDKATTLHENVTISGVVEESGTLSYENAYVEGTAYASDKLVVFTNEIVPFYMDIQKIWKDGLTDEQRKELGITEVHIQLLRRVYGTEDWEVVTKNYFEDALSDMEDSYIVLNKENKWNTTSSEPLPVFEETTGNRYEYQIREIGYQGIFQRYEVSYDEKRNPDYQVDTPEGTKTYLHVTYQAINTPAQLKLKKLWEGSADSGKITRVRVKLLASDQYNPESAEKPDASGEETWVCYKKLSNPNHSCNNSCYIELSARDDWTSSIRNLPVTNKAGESYYYQLAEEEIYLNGRWQKATDELSGCQVTYGNPITIQESEQIAEVTVTNRLTSGNIKIVKNDADDNKKLLPGAEFKAELLKWTEGKLPETVNEEAFDKLEVNEDFPVLTQTTDEKGEVFFQNLPYGIYRITETNAPSGYVPLKKPIYVIISDKAFEQQAKEHMNDASYDSDSRVITIKVSNEKALNLPITGGGGLFKFTLAGLFLLGAAVLMYKFRPTGRRAHQNHKKYRKRGK